MEKTVKILVIVFAAAGLALLGYYWVHQWHTRTVAQTLEQERQGWQERVARLETEVQRLKEEAGPPTAQTDLADVFGSDKPLAQEETVDCQKITTQAVAFFRYLDSQAYLQDYNDSMRAETFFEDVFQRLAANPPTNVGEMDNLYTVIRNITHLYRVLGKERILLINGIAQNEAPVVEPAMGVIFNWMAVCGAGKSKTPDNARLEPLYQYACFFLNTEKYYSQIAQDEEIFEKTRLNDERRTKEIEQFITRFRAKARLAGMVQSRVKALAKMEKKDKLNKLRDLEFSFRDLPFRGKQLLGVRELTFGYPDQAPLFEDLDFSLNAGDRLCVVGPNGKGKTTLLQLLAGNLKASGGTITYHPGVVSGFYEQTNIQTLNPYNTVEEEVQRSHPDVDRQLARNICGSMLFEGDMALKKIEVLSGGEKARVMLGKLLVKPINLLLLDEPSNHLDMASCDALLAAIDNFDGAVIMVTHNEMFLHALAQRLVVFHRNNVTVFEGTYQDFLDKGGWGDDPGVQTTSVVLDAALSEETKRSKKEMRRLRSAITSEHAKARKPVETAIAETEKCIETEERRLRQFNEELVAASQAKEGSRIAQLSQSIHQSQTVIDEKFADLEDLYTRKESLDADLESKLAALGE